MILYIYILELLKPFDGSLVCAGGSIMSMILDGRYAAINDYDLFFVGIDSIDEANNMIEKIITHIYTIITVPRCNEGFKYCYSKKLIQISISKSCITLKFYHNDKHYDSKCPLTGKTNQFKDNTKIIQIITRLYKNIGIR